MVQTNKSSVNKLWFLLHFDLIILHCCEGDSYKTFVEHQTPVESFVNDQSANYSSAVRTIRKTSKTLMAKSFNVQKIDGDTSWGQ